MSDDIKNYRKLLESVEQNEHLEEDVGQFFDKVWKQIKSKLSFKDQSKFELDPPPLLSTIKLEFLDKFKQESEDGDTVFQIPEGSKGEFHDAALELGFENLRHLRKNGAEIYFVDAVIVRRIPTKNSSGKYQFVKVICIVHDNSNEFVVKMHKGPEVTEKGVILALDKKLSK